MRDTTISFPSLGIQWDPGRYFEIGSFKIYYYAIIIALGVLLAIFYAMRRSKQFGLKDDDLLDGVLWILPFAIVCARLYYCFMEWDTYSADPISILYIWKGGLAIYGGVIGAALGIILHCRIKKISLGATFDMVALGFLIGQSLGRWGNFFNREAFGSYSDGLFAMRISEAYLQTPKNATAWFLEQKDLVNQMAAEGGYQGFIQVHPTFLYESLWNLAGFVLLHFLSKKRKYDGQIALGYVAWYGAGRTVIEGMRMDSLYWGPFRVSQLLAAVSCGIAVIVLLWQSFRPHNKEQLYVNKIVAEENKDIEVEDNE